MELAILMSLSTFSSSVFLSSRVQSCWSSPVREIRQPQRRAAHHRPGARLPAVLLPPAAVAAPDRRVPRGAGEETRAGAAERERVDHSSHSWAIEEWRLLRHRRARLCYPEPLVRRSREQRRRAARLDRRDAQEPARLERAAPEPRQEEVRNGGHAAAGADGADAECAEGVRSQCAATTASHPTTAVRAQEEEECHAKSVRSHASIVPRSDRFHCSRWWSDYSRQTITSTPKRSQSRGC